MFQVFLRFSKYKESVIRSEGLFFSTGQMLNVLYVLGALRHNKMPGRFTGWTGKDIEQLPECFFTGGNDKRVFILEALRRNNIYQDFYLDEPERI